MRWGVDCNIEGVLVQSVFLRLKFMQKLFLTLSQLTMFIYSNGKEQTNSLHSRLSRENHSYTRGCCKKAEFFIIIILIHHNASDITFISICMSAIN